MPENPSVRRRRPGLFALALLSAAGIATSAAADDDFPPLEKVTEGYTKVTPADQAGGILTLWVREKDGQVLAELPKKLSNTPFYLTPTIAGGDPETGVYAMYAQGGQGTQELYWRRYDDQLALIRPQRYFRSKGDEESKAAAERVYTDSVVVSTKILGMGPNGGPIIDLDQVLINQAPAWFGRYAQRMNANLLSIEKSKVFPYNAEIAWELPRANGQLTTVHYSLSQPPKSKGFEPRIADRRVGFFYTNYIDRGKNDGDSQTIRYANRWHLEKRDPSLKVSPPAEPIVYYIEHTTPVRYRRWVRDGVLAWNKAFERVGLVNAIEVRQQDATTGAYMDIDPEDDRYSFVRWTNAHMGYAIGPSNAHPDTGEIYQADIVMDEGFIAGWAGLHLDTEIAAEAISAFDAETMAFLDENDDWDPRVRLAAPQDRAGVIAYKRAMREGRAWEGAIPPTMQATNVAMQFASAEASHGSARAACSCLRHAALNMALSRTAIDMGMMEHEDDETMLDGVPESFIGPLLKDVVMHEVGHTLGLMHNWKGTSRYTYSEINNAPENGGIKGEKPWSVTVMDYAPANIAVTPDGSGIEQGDWSAIDIGSYDKWAIEWGYTFEDPDKVAKQAADPDHAFLSDEGQFSPDPHAKVWDIGSDTLTYAENRAMFADKIREKLDGTIVEDGDSWQKAREAYSRSLFTRYGAANIASHWIGGAHVNNYKKGDPDAPPPIRPVPVETQREALAFVLENTFEDDAYGVNSEVLSKLGVDSWWDEDYNASRDYPIHDQILGLQAASMTNLLNPTRLRRVLDNEARVAQGDDALTVPEMLSTIRDAAWSELDGANARGRFTAREPMISTTRRNLQREHINRLIDLSRGYGWGGASGQVIATLAREELRELKSMIDGADAARVDPYTRAHLADASERISRALEAAYLRVD
jgi:hypothetical protein